MTAFPPIPEDGRILFFRRDRPEFGFLSHFHPAPVVLDGATWPTVEHFYQAQKSPDPRYVAAIRASGTPGMAKRIATVPVPGEPPRDSWFVGLRRPRADWSEVKLDIMRTADLAKFTQHPDLAERLLATLDAEIVEDAAHDAFWGVGRDGGGRNWAGRVLMEVRDRLRGGATTSPEVPRVAGGDRAPTLDGAWGET